MAFAVSATNSEQLFRYLFEEASLGIAVEDLDGSLLLANPALCSMLGFGKDELCGMNCSQFTHPDDSQDDWALFQKLRAGLIDRYSLEKRYVRKDGAQIWGRLNVSLLNRGDRGTPLVFAFVEEITKHKLAEKALRESEQRLRLAVQAGRMYAFDWDTTTDAIVRSGECAGILNWMDDPTSDTGRGFLARVHPEDREAYAARPTRLTPENPGYQTSYRVIRPDSSVIWLEAFGHALFDDKGSLLRVTGLVADVTERKHAEQAIRESEARFRLVADTAPVLIWMAGTDKLRTFFNKGWLDFTGRSMEQETGNGWASGVHPDDLERCLGIYSAAFGARAKFEREYRLRRFDGEYRWIVDYGVPRYESNGTFCGYIGSCIDITERKSAEASLRELSGRLITTQEQERSHIARELHDNLSQRMALIQIGLEEFERETAGLSPKDRTQLHHIAQVATEVSTEIHDLSHQLHPSMLDTLGLVTCLGSLCKEFSKQHLRVQYFYRDIPKQIPMGVTLCLFRIVQEALQNVVKHSGAAEAEVRLSGQGHSIDLCISDSGAGFDPASVAGASGLGLISMRERLALVGGHLSVKSELSHGTQIRAHVPLATTNRGLARKEKAHKAGI